MTIKPALAPSPAPSPHNPEAPTAVADPGSTVLLPDLRPVPLPGVPGGPEAAPADERLAAIDIGSNSIHMIVVARDANGLYRVIDKEKDMVRLGRSALSSRGALSQDAIEDGIEALLKMITLARLKGAGQAVAVATSAVREASNGDEFLARVKAQTGLDVRLLAGREEAVLILRAVREVVDLDRGRAAVIDIGGGSTEWVGLEDGEISTLHSLRLGSLRLAGRLKGDPPKAKSIKKLRQAIAEALEAIPSSDADSASGTAPVDTVVATSGTAVCVADLADLAAGREQGSKHLREIQTREVSAVVDRLCGLTRSEIAGLPGVGGPRSESILAGAILLEALLHRLGVDSFSVSDRALREGLVLAALGRPTGEGDEREEPRRRQVRRLARRAPMVKRHSEQTARLAVRLFDLTSSLHGLGAREREWLEYAALLHDLGYAIHYRKHHKHSYYLISNAQLDAFDRREVEIIAHVARYHRGSRPKKKKHPTYRALERWQRRTIKRLAALLRVADALDRTHASRVEEIYCTVKKKKVILEVLSPWDVEIELETAEARGKLFKKVFDRKLILRQGLKKASD